MLIIGLLLLAAVAVVATAAIAGGGGAIDFDVFNNTIESTGTGTFLIGAATGAALLIGLWMVWLGSRHIKARRREFSRLRRAERSQRPGAPRERDRDRTKVGTTKDVPETGRPKDEELVSH
ncbi:MAG TPA: hypothetical protein VKG85_08550 [Actinomycetes bacterium]|nr:hypothetical protein [Actinomycetes bacterium]